MSAIAPHVEARLKYVLGIADSSLILGHRLSEWCGHGPVIEEDIALTNVALDLIGQARSLYAYAGTLDGKGRGEDEFAFQRDENEFRNVTMAELPNGDYGFTITRNFLFLAFQRELFYNVTAEVGGFKKEVKTGYVLAADGPLFHRAAVPRSSASS